MSEPREPRRFQKRPVRVEAMQFTGDNLADVQAWTGLIGASGFEPDWPVFDDWPDRGYQLWVAANRSFVGMWAGQWILKDSLGFYPCDPRVFAETYAEVSGGH